MLNNSQIIHFVFGSLLPIIGVIIFLFSVEKYLPKIYNAFVCAAICVFATLVTLSEFLNDQSLIKLFIFLVINLVALLRFFDIVSDYRNSPNKPAKNFKNQEK